jgi:hypothetical protein
MRSRLTAALVGIVVALLALTLWSALRLNPADDRDAATGGEAASFPSLKHGKLTASPTAVPSLVASRTSPNAPAATPTPPFFPPDEAAMIEADKVSLMIRDYRTLANENPVGTNAEIMAAIMGGNPKGATLGPPEGMSLNENGELIDRWGTPYFFHQLSRDEMEIRSAGADKMMWTDDDAVSR